MTDKFKKAYAFGLGKKSEAEEQPDSHDFSMGYSEGGEVCKSCGGPVDEDGLHAFRGGDKEKER